MEKLEIYFWGEIDFELFKESAIKRTFDFETRAYI